METTHYLTITRPPLVTAHVCDDSTEVVIGIRGGVLEIDDRHQADLDEQEAF
jgi:hypothetical protein